MKYSAALRFHKPMEKAKMPMIKTIKQPAKYKVQSNGDAQLCIESFQLSVQQGKHCIETYMEGLILYAQYILYIVLYSCSLGKTPTTHLVIIVNEEKSEEEIKLQ